MKNLLFVLFIFITSLAHAQYGPNIIFNSNIPNGNRTQGGVFSLGQCGVQPWNYNIVVDSAGPGVWCMLFDCRKSDPLVALGHRVEITCLFSNPLMPQTEWYQTVNIIPTYQDTDFRPWSILQINDSTNALGVKASITAEGKKYRLTMQSFPDGVTFVQKQYDICLDTPGVANDFVLRYHPSVGNDGVVEIWRNGIKMFLTNGRLNTNTILPSTYTVTGPNASSIIVNGTPWPVLKMYYKTGTYNYSWSSTTNPGKETRRVNMVTKIKFGKKTSTITDFYLKPVANVSSNVTITLPTNTASANASASTAPELYISSYLWTQRSGPSTATIATPNSVSTNFNNLQLGTYVFQVRVGNIVGGYDSAVVSVTVNQPINLPPIANAGSNQNITSPTSSVTLNANGSTDPEGGALSYLWTKVSGTGGTISTPTSVSTSVTGLTVGNYVYKVRVTDNQGLRDSSTVTITVNPAPNVPPTARTGANQNTTLPANSLTLVGTTSSDPEGGSLTYLWTKKSGPSTFTIVSPTGSTTVFNNLVAGVYVVGLKVTDNQGASDSTTTTITVNAAPPVNLPPVANAGSNVFMVFPTNTTPLSGSGSTDPEGGSLTYSWNKRSGPSTFTFSSPNSVNTTFSNLVVGVYGITLIVTDNLGLVDSASITVTVNAAPNLPPIADAGSNAFMQLPTNQTVLIGTGSTDPEGGSLTYLWNKRSGPVTFTIASPTSATTNFTNLVAGVYNLTLIVTDSLGAVDSAFVTVTVVAENVPPVARAGNDTTIMLPKNGVALRGSTSTDSDGTIVTYKWTKVFGPTSYGIANSNAANTSVSGLTEGQYVFRLDVTDNNNSTSSASITVTVLPEPTPEPIVPVYLPIIGVN